MINWVSLVLVLGLGILVWLSVTHKGEGLKIGSSSLQNRVSYAYLTKSANDPILHTNYTMGQTGLEEGSANTISSIVANYRGFDTLGEVLVLFASAAGVGMLMTSRKRKKYQPSSSIARTAIPLISLVAIVAGAVMILYGHLSPGGGFPGGALIASGLILLMLVLENYGSSPLLMVLESLAGLSILGVGLAGVLGRGEFLANVFPQGQLGAVFSAGIVLVMNILIGIKVGSEITSISRYFIYGSKEKE